MTKLLKDEYRIESEIGAGGMATVHKAIQKSLGRPVAIKELKRNFHGDAQVVQRFEREAKMAASFQHENIVHIYDYWSKPSYCIVMEYVDGTNLSEILDKTGALSVNIGVMVALQVCDALDYAHMRGVVHRDIKPSNIMIKKNGEVKLMDFGIAQVRSLTPLTLPGMLLGTPSYMSPEQILGQPLDPRSDVFSLGIVLYEMFTGLKPFTDEETQSITAKIMNDRFIPPRKINGNVPRRLQRIIKKCLKKKPQKRYGSAQELAQALGRLVAGKTDKAVSLKRISDYLVEGQMVEPMQDQETIVLSRSSFGLGMYSKLLIAGAALLLLLLGAAGYYFWTQGQIPFTLPEFLSAPAPDSPPSPLPPAR